ncbi:olfactory receptor [Cricetulus griseus]|nr:olfactory receptor [Cricetulus griseus]
MGRRQYKNTSNNRKTNMTPPESRDSTPARHEHPNTEEAEESNLKNNFVEMIESLKEEIKKSFREMEEKTNQKMQEIKESQKSQENTIKQLKETVQDLKTELETIKKTQTGGMLEVEKLSKQSETTDASITNRIQELEDRISDAEDKLEEINSSSKENLKSNKSITQNIQEIWDTVKRPNLRIVEKNYTAVTEFILLGLTDRAELQPVLFVVFLLIYLITVIGNVTMIFLIRSDTKLHTPMYFFLSHLSFVDLCYATNVTPQMLVNFLSKRKTISFIGCFIQFHFFIALVITDYYMLTVMAYDRYMAICKPLLYTSKMSRSVCISLVAAPYIYGFANGLAQTILMLRLTFCGPNEINHFYCADPPLMVLACSDTYVKETAMFVVAGSNLTCSLMIILISYIFIFSAILRIRSAEGRRKAFSTCGSHLVAVTVFYGTLFCMYLRPPSEKSVEQGKIVAVFYIFVSPMLNPLIYSLRNKDVKRAIRKVVEKEMFMKLSHDVPVLSDI